MIKKQLKYPLIVEGKYDQIKISSLYEGQILVTGGFSLFKDAEKRKFFKKLSEKTKILVLTDSDGGGLLIRNLIKNLIPKDRLIQVYIPQIAGKEKRKSAPSKEGFLGVEGMEKEKLEALLDPYTKVSCLESREACSLLDFYDYGYMGKQDSKEKRKELCKKAELPQNLSTKALLEALNLLYEREDILKLL